MLAGADLVDDLDLLRHGGTARLFAIAFDQLTRAQSAPGSTRTPRRKARAAVLYLLVGHRPVVRGHDRHMSDAYPTNDRHTRFGDALSRLGRPHPLSRSC